MGGQRQSYRGSNGGRSSYRSKSPIALAFLAALFVDHHEPTSTRNQCHAFVTDLPITSSSPSSSSTVSWSASTIADATSSIRIASDHHSLLSAGRRNGGRFDRRRHYTRISGANTAVIKDTLVSKPTDKVENYFDEFDFCLTNQDTALTGQSITKALNSATNAAVKNILVLSSLADHEAAYRELELLRRKFASAYEGHKDFESCTAYLDCVLSLGLPAGCPSCEEIAALDHRFQHAFKKVSRVLSDFGIRVIYSQAGRVVPKDKDICLSILDYLPYSLVKGTAVDKLTGEQEEEEGSSTLSSSSSSSSSSPIPSSSPLSPSMSVTRLLNELANRVCRTMCVGNDEDLASLAKEMHARRPLLLGGNKWTEESAEDRFYFALILLLEKGFSHPPNNLSTPYSNAYQKLVDVLVQEVGTLSTPASDKVVSSFIGWERDLRRNLTEPSWNTNPEDLYGSWVLGTDFTQEGLGLEPDIPQPSAANATHEFLVTFKEDGVLRVSPEAGIGLQWRLDPGPTHLDTITFEMISNVDKEQGQLLSYTGYVDRGARVEARFSKRPIKMTGRLTKLSAMGVPRSSARFSMRLVCRGNNCGRCVKDCPR